MTIDIKNCVDCPFFHDTGGWDIHDPLFTCNHPKGRELELSEAQSNIHKDCPLKQDNTITINLKTE